MLCVAAVHSLLERALAARPKAGSTLLWHLDECIPWEGNAFIMKSQKKSSYIHPWKSRDMHVWVKPKYSKMTLLKVNKANIRWNFYKSDCYVSRHHSYRYFPVHTYILHAHMWVHTHMNMHSHSQCSASISVLNPTSAFGIQCLLPLKSKQGRRNNCHFPCWLINWVTFVLLNFTISIGIALEAFNSAVHDSFWENKCLCRGRAKCLESRLTLLWQQSWRKVWIILYSKSRDSDINCTSSWASHFPEP